MSGFARLDLQEAERSHRRMEIPSLSSSFLELEVYRTTRLVKIPSQAEDMGAPLTAVTLITISLPHSLKMTIRTKDDKIN